MRHSSIGPCYNRALENYPQWQKQVLRLALHFLISPLFKGSIIYSRNHECICFNTGCKSGQWLNTQQKLYTNSKYYMLTSKPWLYTQINQQPRVVPQSSMWLGFHSGKSRKRNSIDGGAPYVTMSVGHFIHNYPHTSDDSLPCTVVNTP